MYGHYSRSSAVVDVTKVVVLNLSTNVKEAKEASCRSPMRGEGGGLNHTHIIDYELTGGSLGFFLFTILLNGR